MLRTGIFSPVAVGREQIVIAPHHPDCLRRPPVRPGAVEKDRFDQTLLWNTFRTLELLPPAFWLRRLQARLCMDWFPEAPQTVRVDLWRSLTLPPTHHLDGAKPHVVADVMVETEHAVWTLMLGDHDPRRVVSDAPTIDSAAWLIDCASWYAGTRDCSFGVISRESADQDPGAALVERYFRSKESLRLRSHSPGNRLSNVRGVGSLSWTDLAAILKDCEQADVLTVIERTLALNALTWLGRVGISQEIPAGHTDLSD
jgi:hypothetical protein